MGQDGDRLGPPEKMRKAIRLDVGIALRLAHRDEHDAAARSFRDLGNATPTRGQVPHARDVFLGAHDRQLFEALLVKFQLLRQASVKLAFLKPREMKWLREWTKENITDAAITVSSYDEDKNFIDAKDGWHEATDLVKQMTEHLREAKAALAEHLDHLESLRAIGVLQDELTSWTAELRAKADASTTARNDRDALRSGESGEEQMAS